MGTLKLILLGLLVAALPFIVVLQSGQARQQRAEADTYRHQRDSLRLMVEFLRDTGSYGTWKERAGFYERLKVAQASAGGSTVVSVPPPDLSGVAWEVGKLRSSLEEWSTVMPTDGSLTRDDTPGFTPMQWYQLPSEQQLYYINTYADLLKKLRRRLEQTQDSLFLVRRIDRARADTLKQLTQAYAFADDLLTRICPEARLATTRKQERAVLDRLHHLCDPGLRPNTTKLDSVR